jgi:hypothetical protein
VRRSSRTSPFRSHSRGVCFLPFARLRAGVHSPSGNLRGHARVAVRRQHGSSALRWVFAETSTERHDERAPRDGVWNHRPAVGLGGIPLRLCEVHGCVPAPSELPVDTCGCWHSGFQDFAFTARYRLGTNSVAFTPHARYVLPSYDYRYRGEATIGRNLRELQVGASAGARLPGFLSHASLQASYTYSFVEEVAPDVSVDRSNGVVDLGYVLTRHLYPARPPTGSGRTGDCGSDPLRESPSFRRANSTPRSASRSATGWGA